MKKRRSALHILCCRGPAFVDPTDLFIMAEPQGPVAAYGPPADNIAIPLGMRADKVSLGIAFFFIEDGAFILPGDEPGELV